METYPENTWITIQSNGELESKYNQMVSDSSFRLDKTLSYTFNSTDTTASKVTESNKNIVKSVRLDNYEFDSLDNLQNVVPKDSLIDVRSEISNIIDNRSKSSIKLMSNSEYSNTFRMIVGDSNIINSYGLPDNNITRYKVAAIFINIYTRNEHQYNNTLIRLFKINDYFYNIRAKATYLDDLTFEGIINGKRYRNLLEYTQVLLGPTANIHKSMNYLASILTTMSIKNIFNITRSDGNITNNVSSDIKKFYAPDEEIVPFQLSTEHEYLRYKGIVLISGNRNQVLGGYAAYEMSNELFILPVTAVYNTLYIGHTPAVSLPLNLDLILNNCFESKIIYCCNVFTAIKMNSLLGRINGYNQSKFIVTTFLGNDPSKYNWAFLRWREVIFIPSVNKDSLRMMGKIFDYAKDNLESYKIYPGFILHDKHQYLTDIDSTELREDEVSIIRNSIYLDDCSDILALVNRIITKSLNYSDFIKWGKNQKIFYDQDINDDIMPQYRDYLQSNNIVNKDIEIVNKLEDITLGHFFSPKTSNLIEGGKDSGKSQVGFSIASSIVNGTPLFNVFKNDNDCSKVLYVDCETPDYRLKHMCDHYNLKRGHSFYLVAKLEPDSEKIYHGDISLCSEEFRDWLKMTILRESIPYVIFDHLSGLMGEDINIESSCNTVYKWIEEIIGLGCSVIMIHHLNIKNGHTAIDSKEKGSKKFRIHANTIIHIVSQNEIRNNGSIGTDEVRKIANGSTLTLGINLNVFKNAYIPQCTFWFNKSGDNSNFKLISVTNAYNEIIQLSPSLSQSTSTMNDANNSGIDEDILKLNLDRDTEEEYSKILKYVKDKGSIKTKDAMKIIDVKSSNTAKSRLTKMAELKLLTYIDDKNDNKNCRYILYQNE